MSNKIINRLTITCVTSILFIPMYPFIFGSVAMGLILMLNVLMWIDFLESKDYGRWKQMVKKNK